MGQVVYQIGGSGRYAGRRTGSNGHLGMNHEENVNEHVKFLLQDGVPDNRIKVILVRDNAFSFGVRYNGEVGQCYSPPRAITKSVAKAKNKRLSAGIRGSA